MIFWCFGFKSVCAIFPIFLLNSPYAPIQVNKWIPQWVLFHSLKVFQFEKSEFCAIST